MLLVLYDSRAFGQLFPNELPPFPRRIWALFPGSTSPPTPLPAHTRSAAECRHCAVPPPPPHPPAVTACCRRAAAEQPRRARGRGARAGRRPGRETPRPEGLLGGPGSPPSSARAGARAPTSVRRPREVAREAALGPRWPLPPRGGGLQTWERLSLAGYWSEKRQRAGEGGRLQAALLVGLANREAWPGPASCRRPEQGRLHKMNPGSGVNPS